MSAILSEQCFHKNELARETQDGITICAACGEILQDEGFSLDPYGKCGPDCVAEAPLLDTADGREHDDCEVA